MPYTPPPPPRATTRLWSSEVSLVEALEGVNPLVKDSTYVMNNGRRFSEAQPYAPPDVPTEPEA